MNYHIWYINLPERTDRRAQIESELARAGFEPGTEYTRLEAIRDSFGAIGCAKSHLACLQRAWDSGLPYALVLEDDFTWKADAAQVRRNLKSILSKYDFDVLLLAASRCGFESVRIDAGHSFPRKVMTAIINRHHRRMHRIVSAQTTAGYVIHRPYIPALMRNFEQAVNILERTRAKHLGAIDVTWKELQRSGRWLIHIPGFGKQADGYSDIEGETVCYPHV